MASIAELKWQTLTAAVNQIKSPNQFLKRMLFANHDPVPTEDIEIGVLTKGREAAPFVRKNGEGLMVAGHGQTFQTVSATNIRIKMPFTPSQLLYNRQPGTVIFQQSAGPVLAAVQRHIGRDLQIMADMVTNAEEYLCALALRGTITYEVADQEVFTITFPRSSGHTITLSVFWDDATPATVTMLENIHTVKSLMAEEGLAPTDAICGSEAAAAFRTHVGGGHVKALDPNNMRAGDIDFTTQFSDDGVIHLGSLGGVRFWEYARTCSVNGVSTDMIRAKYVEFVSTSPYSERVLYYGAIPDMKALQGRLFQAERFSKSWEQDDPSAVLSLIHSRPLPVPRKPDATVSMKVVSG